MLFAFYIEKSNTIILINIINIFYFQDDRVLLN